MKTIIRERFFLILISLSLILGFLVFPGYGGDPPAKDNPNKAPIASDKKITLSQTNSQITLLYIDALNFYKEGKCADAANTLEEILDLLKADPYVYKIRQSLEIEPTEAAIEEFVNKCRQKDRDYQNAKKALEKGDYAKAKEIFLTLAQEFPRNEDIKRYISKSEDLRNKKRLKEENLKRITEEKQRKEEELSRKQDQLRAKEEEADRKKQLETEELARKKQALLEQKERQAQEKEAARLKILEEIKQQKEEKEKRIVQEKQRELKEQELKNRLKEEEMIVKKLAEEKLKEEVRLREERFREEVRLREERFREEVRLRKQAELERLTQLTAQKEQEIERRKQELRARQEEAARRKQIETQERARQKEALLEQKERQAREKEAAHRLKRLEEIALENQRKQAEQLKKRAEAKQIQEAEFQRRKQELKAKEGQIKEELKKKKEIEAQEKELARERQLQELQQQKEEESARLTEERKKKQDQLVRKQAELRAKEEEVSRRKQALLKPSLPKPQAVIIRPTPQIKKPLPLAREQDALDSRAQVQERILATAKLNKTEEDQKKIAKIENFWVQARQLYRHGMYEESIKYFQEIIRLEGNPRIKYTPYAKEYIEKAEAKIEEKKDAVLTNDLEKTEKAMITEVVKQQIPPYVEPPEREEKIEEAPLVEPPLIRKKLKKKINLDFDKVDLKSVILFLSQESGSNFVASQKVLDMAPKVSIRFSEAQVDEVVKYITKSLGLIYRIDKDIVWIAHPEEIAQEALETRIYYLSKGGGLFTDFTPISASSETGLGGSSAQISKVSTIEDTLKEVIPWPQDAKITYDKRLNALIVRNTPQNLQMLEDMIYTLDITPCQILIEARFLEVDVTDTKELGLTWKFANENFAVEQKGGSFSHGIAKDSGVDFSAFSRVTEGLNLTYKGLLTAPQFQTVLHALDETKKIKTLSSPRITTLNNQAATIKVVDEWIYPTRYEFEIVQFDLNGDGNYNGAGETLYKNVPKDFLRRDVGILLKVIPAVGADKKTITLSLIPEVSEGVADGFTYTGDVKLPKFTSRNLSTTVVVNSGETVVLGGLIKENRTKTTTKVPFLGDIPLVGEFFKKTADSIERKNLLIFVTAKVLTPSGEEVVIASK